MHYEPAPAVDQMSPPMGLVPEDRAPLPRWSSCPEGIPDDMNLELLANHLLKVSMIRQQCTKHRVVKMLKNGETKAVSKFLKMFPADSEALSKLTSRQLGAIMLIAESHQRQSLTASLFERNRGKNSVEVWLIDRWLRLRLGRSVSILDGDIVAAGTQALGLGQAEPPGPLTNEDAIIAGLSSKVAGDPLDHAIRGLIDRGIIRQLYQDIYDQGKYAPKAALAAYALASLLDSPLPIDLVHQHSEQIFQRHYSNLVLGNVGECISARYQDPSATFYTPLYFSLLSPSFVAAMNVVALRSNMRHSHQGLAILEGSLDPSFKFAQSMLNDFSVLAKSAHVFERTSALLRSRVDHLATAGIISRLNELLREMSGMLQTLSDAIPAYGVHTNSTIDDIAHLRVQVDEFCQRQEGRPANYDDSRLMQDTASILDTLNSHKPALTKLAETAQGLLSEITDLATKDPLGTRDRVLACYDQLESLNPDLDAINTMIGACAVDAAKLIAERLEDPLGMKSQSEAIVNDGDDSELLTETLEENQALLESNRELTARINHIEDELADYRQGQSEVTQSLQQALRNLLAGANTLTTVECLLLIKAAYPDTAVLPSAWSSAQASIHFERTDTLFESLTTLAGEYTQAIVGGTPDAEARKLFPASRYAANESQTTSNGKLRRLREFEYQGESVFFDQHLCIGTAHNTRTTIRVHFKIIAGVLVIAYCGKHIKL